MKKQTIGNTITQFDSRYQFSIWRNNFFYHLWELVGNNCSSLFTESYNRNQNAVFKEPDQVELRVHSKSVCSWMKRMSEGLRIKLNIFISNFDNCQQPLQRNVLFFKKKTIYISWDSNFECSSMSKTLFLKFMDLWWHSLPH